MAIALACPECDRQMKVKDEMAGRRVKCPGCGSAITVPSPEDEEQVAEEAVAKKVVRKTRPAEDDADDEPAPKKKRVVEDEDQGEEEEEERPRKKKKKKKEGNKTVLIGAIVGAVLLVFCLGGGLGSYFLFFKDKTKTPDQAKVGSTEQPKGSTPKESVKEDPKQKLPKPPVGTGKGLVYNVRLAALRPEIQNDMKQIGIFYLEAPSPPTTWAAFRPLLKTAPNILRKFEGTDGEEKIYIINLTGRKLQPTEILAYEYEPGSPSGYCAVRANGQVETELSYEDLMKELGKK
jgi:hypothetical protein